MTGAATAREGDRRGAAAVVALAVFLVSLAYLFFLVPYGFQLEDEGTQLAWFDRVLRGQAPYVDFHTGYTPGHFAFGSGVLALCGTSVTALRLVQALVNATSAACLALLAARVAGAWIAWAPPLLWLVFMPVYVGEFAAFNVPYPTWPVTLSWVAMALALASWIDRPRASVLAGAGVLAAAAMSLRPNSGAFALAAATFVVVARSARPTLLDRAAAAAAAALMAGGVWFAFQFRVLGADAVVHLVPVAAIAALVAGPLARRLPAAGAPPALASLTVLAASFLAPTLAWTLPLVAKLGTQGFLREVLLVGADYQTLYYVPHPSPEAWAALVVAGALAFAAAGRAVAARRVRPVPLLASGAAAAVVALALAASRGEAPEGVAFSIVAQLENASFWLAALSGFAAVAWLARVPAAALASSPRARSLVVVAPVGVAMYLQMFPRSDFMHQVSAVPVAAVTAFALLDRVVAWWARGAWPAGVDGTRVLRRLVQGAVVVVVALAAADNLSGPLASRRAGAPDAPVSGRLNVHVEAAAGDEMDAIAAVVSFVKKRTKDGDALWSFPATSGLLFAAGRPVAGPHDYWYPGRPDRDEEARVLAMLREAAPPMVVTLNRGWNFFHGAPAYFGALRAHFASEYRLALRAGRYDVLARRDLAEREPSWPLVQRSRRADAGSGDAMRAAIEPNLERRRQAAWRWMDAVTPAEAAAAALPAGRRDRLLLLRALRDGGDLRGAAWALLGWESGDARVRAEAADAMAAMARALDDAKARFANDFDAAAWAPFVAPLAARVAAVEGIDALAPFATAVRDVAGAAGSGHPARDAAPASPTANPRP